MFRLSALLRRGRPASIAGMPLVSLPAFLQTPSCVCPMSTQSPLQAHLSSSSQTSLPLSSLPTQSSRIAAAAAAAATTTATTRNLTTRNLHCFHHPGQQLVRKQKCIRHVAAAATTTSSFLHTNSRVTQASSVAHDAYAVLGVNRRATAAEIKEAYLTASKRYHPDLQATKSEKEQEAARRSFIAASAAFDAIGSAVARRAYDSSPAGTWDPLAAAQAGRTNGGTYSRGRGGGTGQGAGGPNDWGGDYRQPYHGESPMKVASNSTIVAGMVLFCLAGLVSHYLFYEKRRIAYQELAEKRNIEAANALNEARERGRRLGPQAQLQRLQDIAAGRIEP